MGTTRPQSAPRPRIAPRPQTAPRRPVAPSILVRDVEHVAVVPRSSGATDVRRPRTRRGTPLGRLTAGGSEGNELLTVWTGVVLIVLLAVLGVTILRLHTTLLAVHLFVGLLLVGPVLVKLGSTGYRVVRYYTRNPIYRRKGPPPALLRMIAPFVVLTTIVVFASGVALLLIGPSSRGALLPVHKVSFVLWLLVTGVHVLGHLPEIRRTLSGARVLRGAVLSVGSLRADGRSAGPSWADGHFEAPAARSPRADRRPEATAARSPRDDGRPEATAARSPRDEGHSAAAPSEGDPHGLRAGRAGRALSLAGGLALGLVLALAAIPRFGPWLSYHHSFLGH